MELLFEASWELGRRFPWISIPSVASIDYGTLLKDGTLYTL